MTDRYESRATTHAQGCWDWGPRHYECAVGQIVRDAGCDWPEDDSRESRRWRFNAPRGRKPHSGARWRKKSAMRLSAYTFRYRKKSKGSCCNPTDRMLRSS